MNQRSGFAIAVAATMLGVACGPSSGPSKSSSAQYQEYECPQPIGKIVREDCSRTALQYEGSSFAGSVGGGGVGASASYKEDAIRQADALVAMLKEQRVGLCNNFNTCKLTVAEYREDQKRLDDSFVALLALKDRMAAMDAEQASKLLQEIQRIRTRSQQKDDAPTAKVADTKTVETKAIVAPPTRSTKKIQVVTAHYGRACGNAENNRSEQMRAACDGKSACSFVVDNRFGDPFPNCPKDFVVVYRCEEGGNNRSASHPAAPDEGYSVALSCE